MRGFRLLLLLFAAAGPAAASPQRIVSMNPCIDQILVGVADARQIAGISHWSHDAAASAMNPAVARRFPAHFGTAEEVMALRPDLVLLSLHTPLATKAALQRMGVQTQEFGVPGSVAESHAQVLAVARAAGHAERGLAMVRAIDRALLASRHVGAQTPALIRMSSGLTPGEGTLIVQLMGHAGFRNQSAAYGLGMWDMAAVEPLVRRSPGLLLTDRPERLHPVLRRAGVRAVRFPGNLFACAGPGMARAAARLAEIRRGVRP